MPLISACDKNYELTYLQKYFKRNKNYYILLKNYQ